MPRERIRINTPARLTKLKRGGYAVRFRIPPHDGKDWGYSKTRKYPDAKTKNEARRAAEEYREELEDEINDYTIKANITFGEYAQRWHEDRKDTGELQPNSWDREGNFITKIKKTKLANIPLVNIRPEDIDEFKKEITKYSKSEQSKLLNKVKQILKFAESRQRIKHDPGKAVTNIKAEPTKQRQSLTAEQQTRLYNILYERIPGTDTLKHQGGKYAAIVIAMATGFRLGEVLGLIWADFDWRRKTLRLERQIGKKKEIKPPKYNSVGIIPLDDETAEYLLRWRKTASKRTGKKIKELNDTPICCNDHFGYYLQSNYEKWFRRFMADNGFGSQEYNKTKDAKGNPRYHYTGYNGPHFHELRHTVATELIGSGADLQTVKSIMRHSRITTTEKYLHDIPDNLTTAIQTTNTKRRSRGIHVEQLKPQKKGRKG